MKKLMFGLFGCLLSLQCFASEFQELDGRIYVSPGSVYVAPDAIYVNINGNFVSVEMVGVDERGIFVMHEANRGDNAICARCGETYNRQKGHRCPDKR